MTAVIDHNIAPAETNSYHSRNNCLREAGYKGTPGGRYKTWLQHRGVDTSRLTLEQAILQLLLIHGADVTGPGRSNLDMAWQQVLLKLGYTGSSQSVQAQFWSRGGRFDVVISADGPEKVT